MHNELRDFLNSKKLVDPAARGLTYGDGPSGSKPLRAALSSFFNSYFHPAKPVEPDQLMVTNGVTTGIEHSAWALANPGEGILLGRPYYRGFLGDVEMRTFVKIVPVTFGNVDPIGPDCVTNYEEALLRSNEAGVKVRAIMLCHPNNPLGRCYSKETIIRLMKMCQMHQIHLISDEIYALSVWKNTVDQSRTPPAPFESVLSIDTEGIIDPALVHVLWGFSKDFGANGIRVGAIISQSNEPYLNACRSCAMASVASSLAENTAKEILEDSAFLNQYLATNQERLSAAYAHAVGLVQRYNIEYVPGANAAFFLWVNLGKKFLANGQNKVAEKSMEGITQTIYDILIEKKVFIVLGDAAGAEEPGWFRLVFTQPPELVEEGVKRIAEALDWRPRSSSL